MAGVVDELGRIVSDSTDLRVMQSFRTPRATSNPYIHMLDETLGETPGLEHLRFSWRTALFASYDALHFHWPEIFLEGRTPLHRLVRRMRFQALLWRMTMRRTAIVRTVHNLELPSGLSGWDRRMLNHIRENAAVSIALNPQTEGTGHIAVILHGHYVDWFARMHREHAQPGRVAFIGLVRRYKGVEALLDAYAELRTHDTTARLAISGRPTSAQIEEEVRSRAAGLPDVDLELDYLSEAAYARAVTAASLITLPYIHMHNSGSVLASLSLGRPVLVPNNAVNRALQAEVGSGWVHLFDGTLDGDDLADALKAGIPTIAPDLTARGWREAGTAHLSAYQEAVSRMRSAS